MMFTALPLVLVVPLYLWLFWGVFVLVMGLYRAYLNKRLTPLTKVLAAPFLGVGAIMDVVCNMTVASLVFAEVPHEMLVTQRLKRHMMDTGGVRKTIALWVCSVLLDPFDPTGHHCGVPPLPEATNEHQATSSVG